MKRLLLIMPNYYGFDEVVIDVLKKYSDCEVFNINYDVGFKYENFQQRLKNAFSKTFLRKNLKPILKEKYFYKQICSFDTFDYLIVNRPDIIPSYILDEAIAKSKKSILLLWDSLEKIPVDKGIIDKFQEVYSFDRKDCELFKFKQIHNFYFASPINDKLEIKYDVTYLGTIDDRINDLKLLMNHLKNKDVSAHAFLHRPRERSFISFEHTTVLKKIIPFKQSDTFSRQSNIVIDLAHQNQEGLSFRFFEAMVLQKKVITTNTHVRKFDFYSPDNIFVIDDINHIDIPQTFLKNPYLPLSKDIMEKYAAQSWVQKLLN